METRIFNGLPLPEDGQTIGFADGRPVTPNKPIIPYIEGDGIGPEISAATKKVVDAAVQKTYGDQRRVVWYPVAAGEKAAAQFGDALPADTVEAIRTFGVAIKGPLSTPTGGGLRSLNVRLRQTLDLYRSVRPVRHFTGVPAVVNNPHEVDIVIFRENTEDVYAGIEYRFDSPEAAKLRSVLRKMGATVRDDTGIGIKLMSRFATERLIRAAIQYAIDHERKTVTIVHKGNIQKFTEGAFQQWCYALAAAEFADVIVNEADLYAKHGGNLPDGKILLNDRIADAMFYELLTRPRKFSVIATMNLNGDYLSDSAAAQVGGLGMAPGANIGDNCAIFEATHGTAATIAGKNIANPCSLLLSAVMMLEYLGWTEAARAITATVETTIAKRTVTADLAELSPGSTSLGTSQFADALVLNLA